jgi:predicted ATP-grasp superfamily ATP-dependent carboligase
VLDANQRSALAVIRSLGRRGLEVIAADSGTSSLGGSSRYAANSVRYADPAVAPDGFVRDITQIARHQAIDVVVPVTDLTTMLLVSQSELSQIARLATANPHSYELLTDKARLIELAGRLGVPVPETRIARSEAAVAEAVQEFGFPVVLKPARSRYPKGDRMVSTEVRILRQPNELAPILRSLQWLADIPCLVQRFVPGHGAGIFALYGPSGPVTWFAHRRIREKPPTGGVSVLSESVPVDPVMRSAAERILSAADWTGVAMVEFRVSADGTPHLMEVNGRLWGSLQLSIDCGIDFPWLLYQVTQGLRVTAPPPYHVGKRLRWTLGDLDSLLIVLRQRSLGFRQKAKALASFLDSFLDARCRQEVLRMHDPRPGLLESWQWAQALRK